MCYLLLALLFSTPTLAQTNQPTTRPTATLSSPRGHLVLSATQPAGGLAACLRGGDERGTAEVSGDCLGAVCYSLGLMPLDYSTPSPPPPSRFERLATLVAVAVFVGICVAVWMGWVGR